MGWPTVLGFISYIVIICCLTVWFTKHHFRNSRFWEEKSETDNMVEVDDSRAHAQAGNPKTGWDKECPKPDLRYKEKGGDKSN